MSEPHGLRASLERRIRVANHLANGFGLLTVVCALLAWTTLDHIDLWLISGTFTLAATVTSVRVVSAARLALHELGPPGPRLFFRGGED